MINYPSSFYRMLTMTDVDYKIKTVVLRPLLDSDEVSQIVENRKTSLFRKILQKPI